MQDSGTKSAMSASGQGSLATYKELCTLVTSLGKPQLLYALIDVAAEATPSAARRGAALGLHAESTDASRALLQPHIAALLPVLYRASYVPHRFYCILCLSVTSCSSPSPDAYHTAQLHPPRSVLLGWSQPLQDKFGHGTVASPFSGAAVALMLPCTLLHIPLCCDTHAQSDACRGRCL